MTGFCTGTGRSCIAELNGADGERRENKIRKNRGITATGTPRIDGH